MEKKEIKRSDDLRELDILTTSEIEQIAGGINSDVDLDTDADQRGGEIAITGKFTF